MKIKKFLKYGLFTILSLIVLLAITYLIAPNFVQNTAVDLLYPTVTIEEKYSGKFTVEVPDVYELMYIACALTETFKKDDNLIGNRTPDYYEEVQTHFEKYSDHPLVKTLEERLKVNPYSQLQPALRMFSLNYSINEENQLIENEVFHVNGVLIRLFKSKIFYYPDELSKIEDFAKQTNYYQFYSDHVPYYNSLTNKYNKLCDLKGMWSWVENRFPERYNSYRIIFSPLTGGFHNTLPGLNDPNSDLKQTWMFISPPPIFELDSLTVEEFEILSGKIEREVFTEIDHNYVNPISDQYIDEIEKAMPDYKEWNHQKNGYSNSLATFNEYMTWGVFSLYARDSYSPTSSDSIISIQEHFMVGRRKFVRFQEFNQELIKLYEKEAADGIKIDIESLYEPMLKWMEDY